MVGVPGRSKGCHTCRKRRIKCDEGKPTCTRCKKAGHICTGYERPLLFRNASTAPFPYSVQDGGAPSQRAAFAVITPRGSGKRLPPAAPPPELSLAAFRDDMCYAFLFDNFVWRAYGTPWLEMAIQGKLGQLPLDASQALSQSNFGSKHRQRDIELNGSLKYSKALKALAPQLSDPRKPGVEAHVITILILMIHASSQGDFQGSYSHIKGATQLLYICGPQRFQREPLRSAFESCRASLVTAHLMIGQRCFLDDEDWRTVPWALDPWAQSFQSRLVNILVMIPRFLAHDLRLDASFDWDLHHDLLAQLTLQLEELFKLRWQWEDENPFSAWEDDAGKEGPFGKPVCFSTVSHANEIMVYNAVLLWLLGLLWKLEPLNLHNIVHEAATRAKETMCPATNHSGSGPLHLPGQTFYLQDVAVEIVRAFEFEMNNLGNAFVSSLFMLMPVGLAWSVLDNEPALKDAIVDALASSTVTRGYFVGDSAFGFEAYAHPAIPESQRALTL